MKWLYTVADRALDQRAGVGSVVEIIAERIANQVGNDNGGGEVNDCLDTMLTDQAGDQRLITSVADDKRGLLGYGPAKAGRQIVENDNALAGIDKLQNHVTADVAGTAGNQEPSFAHPEYPLGGIP